MTYGITTQGDFLRFSHFYLNSEPVGRASEQARLLELAERSSKLAGKATEPAGRALMSAGRGPKPGRRPQGGGRKQRKREKRRKSPYVVLPQVIVPYGAAAQKAALAVPKKVVKCCQTRVGRTRSRAGADHEQARSRVGAGQEQA